MGIKVLRRSEGALQLLDVAAQLPALRRMAGRSQWVGGNGSALLSSWGEAEAQQVRVVCQSTCHIPVNANVMNHRHVGALPEIPMSIPIRVAGDLPEDGACMVAERCW